MKNTLEQLRSRFWPSLEAATKELKRNGFAAHGADYELRQYAEGSWQVMPLEGDASPDAKPAPAAKARPAAKAAKPAAAAKAKPKPKPTATPEPEPEPEPAATPEPEPKPAATPAGTDLSALPTPAAPSYEFRILASNVTQNSAVAQALEISRLGKVAVWIEDGKGNALRMVDYAAVKAAQKTVPGKRSPAAAGAGPKSNPKVASLDEKTIKKLIGAALAKALTSADVRSITGWTDPKMSIRNAMVAIAAKTGGLELRAIPDPTANRLLWSFAKI